MGKIGGEGLVSTKVQLNESGKATVLIAGPDGVFRDVGIGEGSLQSAAKCAAHISSTWSCRSNPQVGVVDMFVTISEPPKKK
jgi:hypothetical protein